METRLSDGLVVIAPYSGGDAVDLYTAARESVAEVQPWLPWCHPGYRREEAEAWTRECPRAWARGEAYDFTVRAAGSGRFLGGCSINRIQRDHRLGNVGYWVRSTATGRGVATSATRLVVRFGLEQLLLVRLEIVVATGNGASRRVAEKVGAKAEGVARDRLVLEGVPHDAVIFSIVAGDVLPEAEVVGPRPETSARR